MSGNAWILVSDKESWLEIAHEGSYGLKRSPGRLRDAQPEDPIVAYVKGDVAFAGIGKLTSSLYYEEGLEYPHRVKLDISLDFDNSVDVRPLIEKLDFINDKLRWPVFFKGAAIKIPLSDFNLIKASIERQKTKAREITPISRDAKKANIAETIRAMADLSSSSLHDRLAEMIHVVGLNEGYDSVQRYRTRLDSPYQIDVAWLRNKNPQIAVEIHHGGVLGDALDRLRHARDFNFRKVILVLVEPEDQRRALDLLKFDEKLKHVIDLWSMQSVYDMYMACRSFHSLYGKFEQSIWKEQPDRELS
ncbi:MAG: hypothetical protein FJ025_02815 [Chloroflexi bacterium]|nr:hypothetical protein [Chloroflexota bacterium]